MKASGSAIIIFLIKAFTLIFPPKGHLFKQKQMPNCIQCKISLLDSYMYI